MYSDWSSMVIRDYAGVELVHDIFDSDNEYHYDEDEDSNGKCTDGHTHDHLPEGAVGNQPVRGQIQNLERWV